MIYQKSLFIFRRDLRLEDNNGLLFALENSKVVIPCFIFTPEQIEKNPFRSDHCLQFMLESLEELDEALRRCEAKLYYFYGKNETIIETCIKHLSIDAIIVNRDYTPYSRKRDENMLSVCNKYKIAFHSFDDLLLNSPEEILKENGKPYTIFTPYYHKAIKSAVTRPKENTHSHYSRETIPFAKDSSSFNTILPIKNKENAFPGGRTAALKILKSVVSFSRYGLERDFPSIDGTTHLSAYLKFTVCSVREIYHAISNVLGPHHELLRQLYWRDFFTSIAFFFPHVFEKAFQHKYEHLEWNDDETTFERWCEGKTGFPIVDAGMRQMNQTGFMHNRVRMVAASFLVKDLHISWQKGEKYFAQKLIDYDPAVNNGNWQWAASTGCDAQPYFRIFNPWLQQKKFDKDCIYIKRWIPELGSYTPKAIHEWYKEKNNSQYPDPIVDHSMESKAAIKAYRS